jgi:hypothetical protein
MLTWQAVFSSVPATSMADSSHFDTSDLLAFDVEMILILRSRRSICIASEVDRNCFHDVRRPFACVHAPIGLPSFCFDCEGFVSRLQQGSIALPFI